MPVFPPKLGLRVSVRRMYVSYTSQGKANTALGHTVTAHVKAELREAKTILSLVS